MGEGLWKERKRTVIVMSKGEMGERGWESSQWLSEVIAEGKVGNVGRN